MDFGYEMSASAVFRAIADSVPAYSGMRYPLLKDETNPIQAKYQVGPSDVTDAIATVRNRVESFAG